MIERLSFLARIARLTLLLASTTASSSPEAFAQSQPPRFTEISARAALQEFGLVGKWATNCATPNVVVTFDLEPAPQLLFMGPNGGMRIEIVKATKGEQNLVILDSHLSSIFKAGKWQPPAPHDSKVEFGIGFGRRGDKLVSLHETEVRLGVPSGAYVKCATLGQMQAPASTNQMKSTPRPWVDYDQAYEREPDATFWRWHRRSSGDFGVFNQVEEERVRVALKSYLATRPNATPKQYFESIGMSCTDNEQKKFADCQYVMTVHYRCFRDAYLGAPPEFFGPAYIGKLRFGLRLITAQPPNSPSITYPVSIGSSVLDQNGHNPCPPQ